MPATKADRDPGEVELGRRARRGDTQAFHQIVDRHAAELYRLAYSLIGNAADAEDVLQETFTAAFRGFASYEERSSVRTWLTGILVRQAARWHRTAARRKSADGPEDVPVVSSADPDARVDIAAALASLSEEHRQVIVLREIHGMSYEEIAKAVQVPRGTVESRLHRARRELANRLKDYLT